MAGYTLIELLCATALATTLAAVASLSARSAIDEYRALGAVRYLSGRLQSARMEAATRGADVALRFTPEGETFRYALYTDGNRNGVLSRDIERGIDRELRRPESLGEHFAGVGFGAAPGLPAVDASSPAPGTDPIRIGSGHMLTFDPSGTSSAGSLYVRGKRNIQYVVRVFAETGKTRILRFDWAAGRWTPLSGS